jgi:hypothetical protein
MANVFLATWVVRRLCWKDTMKPASNTLWFDRLMFTTTKVITETAEKA